MLVFPDYLTLISSYAHEVQPSITKTSFEDGYVKNSVVNSQLKNVVKLKYYTCTSENYLKFVQWHKIYLNQGSNFFLWNDPVTGKNRRVRFVDGLYSAENDSNIYDGVDGGYNISFSLEFWS